MDRPTSWPLDKGVNKSTHLSIQHLDIGPKAPLQTNKPLKVLFHMHPSDGIILSVNTQLMHIVVTKTDRNCIFNRFLKACNPAVLQSWRILFFASTMAVIRECLMFNVPSKYPEYNRELESETHPG